jgi:type VI secretion system protein VasJ
VKSLIDKIIEPISSENPVGKPTSEGKTRDFLEDEVMKIGTLEHGKVDWKNLEEKTIKILSKECKDFKILSYLMLALQCDHNPERFLISLEILAKFSSKYWARGFPNPGEKPHALKRKLLTLMLNRSLDSVKQLKLLLSDNSLVSRYEKVCASMDKIVVKHKLKLKTTSGMSAWVKNELSRLEEPKEEAPVSVLSEKPVNTVNRVVSDVNLSDERKTKESYLQLAQFTNESDIENVLGYQLRRFGLWHNIYNAPPNSKQGNTEMRAVSDDRVLEYIESINTRPSKEILMRIEQTLESSPFWIKGSYLAALCANELNMPKVSDAILSATVSFLEKTPSLLACNFSDGSAFVDEEVQQWLGGKQNKLQTDVFSKELEKTYNSKGLEATLSAINKKLKKSKDQRDICHLKLLAAEFFRSSGMESLAITQLQALEEETKQMLVSKWEPAFIKRLAY